MPKNSHSKFLFRDHRDAADQLIEAMPIASLIGQQVSVLAISEEAVSIADRVAQALRAPMDLLLSAPIPAPHNPDLPIAQITETQTLVMNRVLVEAFGIDEEYVYDEAKRRHDGVILSRMYRYRHGEPIHPVTDRVVVLVDVCVETGLTALVAIKSMIDAGVQNVYLAVPILDASVRENLITVCDGVYTPHAIRDYITMDYYYEHTEPLTEATNNETKEETIERILQSYE